MDRCRIDNRCNRHITIAIMRKLLAIVSMLLMIPAYAQNWPAKSVRIIVGFPPGGSTDIMARLIVPGLTETFRQQFVVDNRPGANSNIASELAAKSPADGYTVLVVSASFSTNPGLYPKVPYDPIREFTPVTRIAAVNNVLVVHPSMPVKNVKELVALVKARPGQFVFASSGTGSTSHLAMELLKTTVGGFDAVHVPYKGVAPAVVDLMAGHVHALVSTMPTAVPHVQSGRLRALAVASLQRASALRDVPTFDESGYRGFEASAWNAVLVPAGTPNDVVTRLNAAIVKIVQTPDIREKLAAQGAEPVGDTPEQFAAYLRAELTKWAKVAKASGARVD
jgi:tripartite-type tricarboxylate transporter receptor subunit TctC